MYLITPFLGTRNAILKRLARVDKLRHLVLDILINFRSENAGNMTSMVGSIVEDNREQEKPIDREKVCISNGRILK